MLFVKDGVNFRITPSFDNVWDCREIGEKVEKVNSRKAYTANVGNSL